MQKKLPQNEIQVPLEYKRQRDVTFLNWLPIFEEITFIANILCFILFHIVYLNVCSNSVNTFMN